MSHNNSIENYFISIHQKFGISELSFDNNRLNIDEEYFKNMVFAMDEFGNEFENIIENCQEIYQNLKKGFSLKVKRTVNNNYIVNII